MNQLFDVVEKDKFFWPTLAGTDRVHAKGLKCKVGQIELMQKALIA